MHEPFLVFVKILCSSLNKKRQRYTVHYTASKIKEHILAKSLSLSWLIFISWFRVADGGAGSNGYPDSAPDGGT